MPNALPPEPAAAGAAGEAALRWARVKALFDAALDAAPVARAALLARATADDPATAREVASLLAAHDADGGFLDVSAVAAASRFVPDEGAGHLGRRVGPYRLLREVGRGGMGVVFLAERDDDAYRKQVAVKLIKRGMDTDAVVDRFRHERQILATLDHPNVARLLDGGTTPDGLPYFVMEYVDGTPVDAYCAARRATLAERLTLFRRVCGAVHFAHQQLVIHRDLKPGNILVTGDGTPKLLDFGLAKLLAGDGAAAANSTLAAAPVRAMTPEYASPEQLRGERLNTLSDVYALGVLLHELVTGERPYRLTSRDPEQVAQTIAARRPAPSAAGRALLRGDLGTVVAKAMHPEPARRYVSAEQLGEEVTRYLERRPLIARPDTWSYRGAQFVRRNRVGVAAAALVGTSLIGGLGAAAWQARVARQERARAEARFADVRRLAGAVLFELDDAIEPLAGSTHARELVVERSLEYLDRLARTATVADASLQRELAAAYARVGQIQGNTYYPNLGHTAGAAASYRTSLAIRQQLAARVPNDRTALADLAEGHRGVGDMLAVMDSIPQARQHYEQALRIRKQLVAAGATDVETRAALAEAHVRLGDIAGVDGASNLNDLPGALRHYEQALALREAIVRAPGADSSAHLNLATTLSNAGFLARSAGHPDTAVAYGRRAVAELETLTVRHPQNAKYRQELLGAYNNLRYPLVDLGYLDEAIANSRRTVPMMAALADADPSNRTAQRNLGVVRNTLGRDLLSAGDAPGALDQFRRALVLAERGVAADPASADARRDLAFTLRFVGAATDALGDHAGALGAYRRALAVQLRGLTPATMKDGTRDDLAAVYGGMAVAYGALGRGDEALGAARRAVALADTAAAHAPAHAGMQTRRARRLFELGAAERRLGHAGAACAAFARSRDGWEALRRAKKLPFADARGPDDAARALGGCAPDPV